jgi:N-acetylglucosaminyldiphosphoundecaprenol N-acetyl-beta-D-mannosaminyltransferase
VYGPDLTLAICSLAARRGVTVAFVGGTEHTLILLERELQRRFPRLQISLVQSPPFRATSPPEDAELVRRIATSGAGIVFVGLGCPKQERWMAEHKGRVPAVMVGVGAAFDFLAGTKPQAPRWMMRWGLEWLFRLSAEPRRLWRRYLYNNPRFVALFALQVAGTWGRIVRDRRGRAPKRPSAVSAREPSS